MEKWKNITGYEGSYQVSSYGRVKSIKRMVPGKDGRVTEYPEREIKWLSSKLTQRHPSPMFAVELWKGNKRKRMSVHRLVGMAFIPNPDGKPQINHLDGNRNNNRVDNLEWCTSSENNYHAYANNLTRPSGGKAVIGKNQKTGHVVEFRNQEEAGQAFGVTACAIRASVKGRTIACKGYVWKFKD